MKDLISSLIKSFQRRSAETLLQANLEEDKRNLIAAQSQAAYASKMVEYYEDRINMIRFQISNGIEETVEKQVSYTVSK